MSSCISRYERNSVLFIVAALLIFLLYDPYGKTCIALLSADSFLLIHILLEFLSVSICFIIAILGCVMYPLTKSRYIFLFSILFFYVGIFDGFHTLSFQGMPFGLNPDAATWFWTIARIVEVTGITLIFTKADKTINIRQIKSVAVFIVVIGIVVSVSWYRSIVYLPSILPVSNNLQMLVEML